MMRAPVYPDTALVKGGQPQAAVIAPRGQAYAPLARNYHLTGADVFAEVLAEGIRRWLREYYRWVPGRQITTPKYIIPSMILDWDNLEEHPAFSDELRLEYTSVLYDYVSRMGVHPRITQLKPGVLAGTGHHYVSLTVTYGGRYFKTYYPHLPMDRIDAGLASVRTGLDTIANTYGFFDENDGYTGFHPRTTMSRGGGCSGGRRCRRQGAGGGRHGRRQAGARRL